MILQHIRTVRVIIPHVPDVSDYWEAFRVLPGANTRLPAPITNPGVLNRLQAEGIDPTGIEGSDWYGQFDQGGTGSTETTGEVYFLDNMDGTDLQWGTTAVPESGGLPAIHTDGHRMEIAALLRRFNAVGPFPHNITVSWQWTNNPQTTRTTVLDKTP
jgi:hypothetical protein